jgi:hypothetical protein
MKLRNIALAGALALPAVVMVAGSGPSSAATTPVTFAGTLSGQVFGSIKITPGLSLSTPSTVPTKFVTSERFTNLVASKGLTQKGVKITAARGPSTVTVPAGVDCATLEASGLPLGVITANYTTTGGTATPTKFKPGKSTVSILSSGVIRMLLGGTGTTTTGSFRNGTTGSAASSATLTLDQTKTTLNEACASSTGLTSISFTEMIGVSTFNFG